MPGAPVWAGSCPAAPAALGPAGAGENPLLTCSAILKAFLPEPWVMIRLHPPTGAPQSFLASHRWAVHDFR